NYNADKYEEIFKLFSAEMKKALPIEKTKHFLTNLESQVGNIQRMEFVGFQQEAYAMYKTTFEKDVLALNISVNEQNQINGLFIKPFDPTVNQNKTINSLSKYPKEIAEIIFSKSKDLPKNTQLSIAIIQNGKVN